MAEAGEQLLVHNYVLVEAAALLQSRAGFEAADAFLKDAAVYESEWIDAAAHAEARALFSRLRSSQVSFVDCASFVVMRRRGVKKAFAFDRHFAQQGFQLVP